MKGFTMRIRPLVAALNVLLLAALLVLNARPVVARGDAPATEDILYMHDGRELRGQIISEDATTIVFEYFDRTLNIKSKLTIRKADVAEAKKDVPIEAAAPTRHATPSTSSAPAAAAPGAGAVPANSSATKTSSWGSHRMATDRQGVPSIYIVPMRGQLGTDIHPSAYERVVEDIDATRPDVLVFWMDSKDFEDVMFQSISPQEGSMMLFDEYRNLVKNFQDRFRNIRQVMWVHDSVGLSSPIALAWKDVFMTSDAMLGGMQAIVLKTGADKWQDEDVRAKMMAAWTGSAKSLMEYGDCPLQVADAMMIPEKLLSGSFIGRKAVFSFDTAGDIVVDSDDEATVGFTAKVAEDLLVADGIADDLDDVAFLLGHREYRIVGDAGKEAVESYIKEWRRQFDNTQTWMQDFQQHMGWVSGDESLKWLGQAKQDLQKIVDAMKRYPAIEMRWRSDPDLGASRQQLEVQIEQINEQIRALKNQGRGGAGEGGDDGGRRRGMGGG
jgi:hypothetical protein